MFLPFTIYDLRVTRYEWAFHGAPAYEVATTGNLLALTQPSNFRPDQLIDTGATAGAH